MRTKTLAIALAVSVAVLLGVVQLWTTPDSSRSLAVAEDTSGDTGRAPHGIGAPHEQGKEPEGGDSSRKPSFPHSTASGTTAAAGPSEAKTAASESTSSSAPGGGVSDDRKNLDAAEEFARFRELVAALGAFAEGKGAAPFDAQALDLSAQDVAKLDFDGDQLVTPSEIETADRLAERTENHPIKNDVDDGAYPIAEEDYRRAASDFETIDTSRDGLIDEGEYYEFLVDTQKVSVALDSNGDRDVSFEESKLSESEFAPLDRNDSGALEPAEMRRAMGSGIWGRPSD